MSQFWRSCLYAVLATCLVGLGFQAPAWAKQAASPSELRPLSDVLDALSREYRRPIVASPDLLRGRMASVPQTAASLEAALTGLLEIQSLDFDVLESGVVVIRTAPSSTVTPQATRPPRPELEPDTVIVRGRYSGSLASARHIRRRSTNMVEAIDAQDIGDYPSRNLAESLLRVPGVSIERERGEGLFVSVRGLAPNFQIVTQDGKALAVNENVRDSGQDGRQFRFDVLAPDTIAGVTVNKTPLATQDEGAIGATIDIKTYDPLDLPNRTVRVSAAASYSDLADSLRPRVSGLASWQNETGSSGLLLAGSYMEREGRQDRVILAGYDDLMSEGASALTMTSARPTLEMETRRRLTLNGKWQWRSDAQSFELGLFHSRLDSAYHELTYSAELTQADQFTTLTVADTVGLSVEGPGTSQIGYEQSELRHDLSLLSLEGRQDWGDWDVRAELTGARAVSTTTSPIVRTRLKGEVGLVRISQPTQGSSLPEVRLLETRLDDPQALPFRRIEWRHQESVDEEYGGGLHGARAMDAGIVSDVKLGASFRSRSRTYTRRDVLLTDLAGQRFGAELFRPFPVSGFLEPGPGILNSWLQPYADAFLALSDQSELRRDPTPLDLRNSYKVTEEIAAAYAMADIESSVSGRPLRANLGLRLTHSLQRSEGHAEEDGVAVPISTTRSYVDPLPSFNAVYEATDRLWLRAAAARVITRPSLADLAPRLTLNSSDTVREARGGNPGLGRYQAWQYDLSADYETPSGFISLSLFHKDIDQFVFDQVTTLDLEGVIYELTGPENGGRASVSGVELAAQLMFSRLPAPLDRMGVHANYTLTRSRAHYSDTLTDDLPDVAPSSYHVTAFYEGQSIQGRLAYSWRDDLIASVGPDAALISNRRAFGSLDATASWSPVEAFELQMQATNLLNHTQSEFVGDDLFAGYTEYGRTLSLVARYSF